METVRGQARLIYDLLTFNFDMAEPLGLGATIPPELFPFILYYASNEDRTEQVRALYKAKSRAGEEYDDLELEIELEKAAPRYALQSCSLVSRYWANQCRKYMFRDAVLTLNCLEDAQAFRQYALEGSKELIPIHKLIRWIDATQVYVTNTKSFLDIAYIPSISRKFRRLRIVGPAPPGFPPSKLDTPHWRPTNLACITPAVTAYQSISIGRITVRSFIQVVKYIKHFRNATDIRLNSVTWSDNGEVYLLRPIPTSRSRQEIRVEAYDCTDNFLVCWQGFAMYSDSPIHTIVDRDQRLVLLSLVSIRDYYLGLSSKGERNRQSHCTFHSCKSYPRLRLFVLTATCFTVKSEIGELSVFGLRANMGPESPSITAQFFCDWRSPVRDVTNRGSPKPLRVLGALLIIKYPAQDSREEGPELLNLASLREQLEHSCALRVVTFVFDSYPTLRKVVEQHSSLSDMWPHVGCMYRFVCRDSYEHPFPNPEAHDKHNSHYWDVDPATLEPTGAHFSTSIRHRNGTYASGSAKHWESATDIVPSILSGRA